MSKIVVELDTKEISDILLKCLKYEFAKGDVTEQDEQDVRDAVDKNADRIKKEIKLTFTSLVRDGDGDLVAEHILEKMYRRIHKRVDKKTEQEEKEFQTYKRLHKKYGSVHGGGNI